MKETQNVISLLNSLLTDEFATLNQYYMYSESSQILNNRKIHEMIYKKEIDEIIYASWLIQRIALLGGTPSISVINHIKMSKTASEMLLSIKDKEHNEIAKYNEAIAIARYAGDMTTVELLRKILNAKKGYIDLAEMQYVQNEKLDKAYNVAHEIEMPSHWF